MPHTNRNGLREGENPKGVFNKLVNIGVILTLAILVSKVMRYAFELEEVKKITNAHAWFHYIWVILTFASVAIIILLCIQTFSGKKIILWNKKEDATRESRNILAPLIGIMFVVLLFTASYYLLQAGAHYQTERGLLATQGLRNPPREQKFRIIDKEMVFVLNPGQKSQRVKIGGTQGVNFNPKTIPSSDVSILRYYPLNGGSYQVLTNKLWDHIEHVVEFELELQSNKRDGPPIHIEVSVGQ